MLAVKFADVSKEDVFEEEWRRWIRPLS